MQQTEKSLSHQYLASNKRKWLILLSLFILLLIIAFFSLFIGSSDMSFSKAFMALFSQGSDTHIRIMQQIRLPRILTGLLCGAGLSISGLILQTCLDNPLSSPSTLGISNASVLGANIAIIALSGSATVSSYNPFAVTSLSFLFAVGATLAILGLAKFRSFQSETIILTGVALSSVFTAVTTLIQYFANDVSLSSAVYWSFGDLSRTGYREIIILASVIVPSCLIFFFFKNQLNAFALGDDGAKTSGVNTELFRFIFLLLSSLITAVCVAFLGIIGFVGLVAPHIVKKTLGENHRFSLLGSALVGSLLLIISDDIARVIMQGFSLPVGAITAVFGAPFFLYIIFNSRRRKA